MKKIYILPLAVRSDNITVTVMSLVEIPPVSDKVTGTTPDSSEPE